MGWTSTGSGGVGAAVISAFAVVEVLIGLPIPVQWGARQSSRSTLNVPEHTSMRG